MPHGADSCRSSLKMFQLIVQNRNTFKKKKNCDCIRVGTTDGLTQRLARSCYGYHLHVGIWGQSLGRVEFGEGQGAQEGCEEKKPTSRHNPEIDSCG